MTKLPDANKAFKSNHSKGGSMRKAKPLGNSNFSHSEQIDDPNDAVKNALRQILESDEKSKKHGLSGSEGSYALRSGASNSVHSAFLFSGIT